MLNESRFEPRRMNGVGAVESAATDDETVVVGGMVAGADGLIADNLLFSVCSSASFDGVCAGGCRFPRTLLRSRTNRLLRCDPIRLRGRWTASELSRAVTVTAEPKHQVMQTIKVNSVFHHIRETEREWKGVGRKRTGNVLAVC